MSRDARAVLFPDVFISVEGLFKSYRDGDVTTEVLRGVDLTIRQSEIIAVVGASGAGKSTLLHLLGGLDRPTSGSIRYEGIEITSHDDRALTRFRRSDVGFVFQFHHLLPEFSAAENVAMSALIAGDKPAAAATRARELLDLVGMSARTAHRPPKLSGGERQRVAIARALVNSPRVILADEPTGNLDRATSQAIHDMIWGLRDRLGQTFVVVTHNAELAQRADRTIHLLDGRISAAATDVP